MDSEQHTCQMYLSSQQQYCICEKFILFSKQLPYTVCNVPYLYICLACLCSMQRRAGIHLIIIQFDAQVDSAKCRSAQLKLVKGQCQKKQQQPITENSRFFC